LRYLLSVLTAVAALATAFALYFGYQAREETQKETFNRQRIVREKGGVGETAGAQER
jgi:hypothetical protein